LEDYLTSTELTVDGQLDDGWGAKFPVKGRQLEATVLFCDITGFSAKTLELGPAETLAFVNNFFAWISAESLRHFNGIVDKYIGDEVMVVFAREFGSEDPLGDAVRAARWMGENDFLAFRPHIGIASGPVMIGHVGTPLRYNCSVFGVPVALANRCAGVESPVACSTRITLPAAEWQGRDFEALLPPRRVSQPDGSWRAMPNTWRLLEPRAEPLKNVPATQVQQIVNEAFTLPGLSAVDRAKVGIKELERHNRYWPNGRDRSGGSA
jgi:class 3 adenylate cyclase